MKKETLEMAGLIILAVLLCIVALLVLPFVNLPGREAQVLVPPNGAIAVIGEMVCLPHKDTRGPQTLECAFGLFDTEGRYFGLSDSDPSYANISSVPMNTKVEVIGEFKASMDSKYQSVGTITAASITPVDTPRRMTLEGEYLCLPHRDTTGPQTDECAAGLRTDDGTYYALDFMLASMTTESLVHGSRATFSGPYTPIERISSDHWRIYPIEGILSVTDFSL